MRNVISSPLLKKAGKCLFEVFLKPFFSEHSVLFPLVPAVAEVVFLAPLGHGALKSSASSAAIGTQWCVSEEGILS
jgi:hypothetical protein